MAAEAQQTQQEPNIADDLDADIEMDVGHEMTREEAREFFDEQARAWLGMSGEEFMRAWDAGEFDEGEGPERTDVTAVALLLGFGRYGSGR